MAERRNHVPVVVQKRTQGAWGVVCHGCSSEQMEYVETCRYEQPEWPPSTLFATPPAPPAGGGE